MVALDRGTGVRVRKLLAYRETLLAEGGVPLPAPVQRMSVAAVLANPWIGAPTGSPLVPDVADFMPTLALRMTRRLLDGLGGQERVEAFGKGAIVGAAGELEHAGAVIHTPYFGNIVRDELGGTSIICFADARAEAGFALTVPLWHKTHAATRSHYQALTVRVPDAPRPDELVLIAAASTGPRPLARIGDRTTDPSAEFVREVAMRHKRDAVAEGVR